MSIGGLNTGSNGIAGLASGINTQQMVDKLLAGTKAKIDKQNQLKQQIIWKQEAYRDILSSLNTFQKKYFSFSSPTTNLLSSSLFNSMSSIASSDAIKVTGTSNAAAGKLNVNSITQLATNRKEQSSSRVTAELSGNINIDNLKKEISIRVDGQDKKISFTGSTKEEMQKSIDAVLKQEFTSGEVSAVIEDDKLVIKHTDTTKSISITGGTDLALSYLGVSKGATSDKGVLKTNVNETSNKLSLNVTMDGIRKQIFIDSDNISSEKDLVDRINKSLQDAFGNGIKAELDSGKIKITNHKSDGSIDNSRNVVIDTGNSILMNAISMKEGQSNKINLSMSLKDSNFATKVQGSSYSFTINGVNISGSTNDSIATVISKINSSKAGVKVTYSSLEDKFVIESEVYGNGVQIDMKQEEGNVLTALFGTPSSSKVSSSSLYDSSIYVSNNKTSDNIKGGSTVSFSIDGKKIDITIPKKTSGSDTYTRQELVSIINTELKDTHKLDVIFKVSGDQTIVETGGKNITFYNSDAMSALGFDAKSNTNALATEKSLLKNLGLSSGKINVLGKEFDLSNYSDKPVSEFITDVNKYISAQNKDASVKFDSKSGKIIISGVTNNTNITGVDAAGKNAMNKLFGVESVEFSSNATGNGTSVIQEGQNAELVVNGQSIERNSNSFEINGIKIELLKTSSTDISIETKRDNKQIVDAVKSFVKDYNEMIDKLQKIIDQEATYKEYPPLTDEQKKELTETEIKLWEEKSKQGLLRGDQTIKDILSAMRSIMYQKPEGGKFALYDLGITTGRWQDGGKINFDENNTKFLEVLERDPSEIQRLFTDATNGIATSMNKVLDKYTKSNSPGSITELAGIKGSNLQSSILGRQIKSIETKLKGLKSSFEKEKARYWKQFNSMEKLISKMNQQSSWLAQQTNQQ